MCGPGACAHLLANDTRVTPARRLGWLFFYSPLTESSVHICTYMYENIHKCINGVCMYVHLYLCMWVCVSYAEFFIQWISSRFHVKTRPSQWKTKSLAPTRTTTATATATQKLNQYKSCMSVCMCVLAEKPAKICARTNTYAQSHLLLYTACKCFVFAACP